MRKMMQRFQGIRFSQTLRYNHDEADIQVREIFILAIFFFLYRFQYILNNTFSRYKFHLMYNFYNQINARMDKAEQTDRRRRRKDNVSLKKEKLNSKNFQSEFDRSSRNFLGDYFRKIHSTFSPSSSKLNGRKKKFPGWIVHAGRAHSCNANLMVPSNYP